MSRPQIPEREQSRGLRIILRYQHGSLTAERKVPTFDRTNLIWVIPAQGMFSGDRHPCPIEQKGHIMSQSPSASRYRWRIVDIVVGAVLGIAVGLVFFAWNFAGDTVGDALKLIYPPLKGLMGGMWLLGGVLGGLIIRKPGAAVYVELLAAMVPALMGNQWGPTVLVSGLVQGLGAELVFLVFLYRVWKLPVAILAGALAGVFEWVYEIFVWWVGYPWSFKIPYLIFLAISGAILAGVLGWLIQQGLARTGVLNRFESGREARALV